MAWAPVCGTCKALWHSLNFLHPLPCYGTTGRLPVPRHGQLASCLKVTAIAHAGKDLPIVKGREPSKAIPWVSSLALSWQHNIWHTVSS
jgi:hypothetical protein